MNLQQRLDTYFSRQPQTEEAAFIAPGAQIMGDVSLGPDSSVWYGTIIRADINSIRIGQASNIQDGSILHLSDDFGVDVGDYVTVGHGAILHACTIGNETLIGMRATVLDGARIGNQCIVGANALVPQNFEAPDGSLILGSPAKVVKTLDDERRQSLRNWAEKYVQVAKAHAARRSDYSY